MQLTEILSAHAAFLRGENDGVRADLRNADLHDADLRNANLHDADLRNANLWGANLRGANLQGADFRGADFYGADLRNANLRGANLQGADFWGANLRGANLYGADLQGANLYGAIGCISAQSPTSRRVTFFHPDSDYIQSGCRKTNLAGFIAAVAERYPDESSAARRGYEAIIALFLVYAKNKQP